MTNSMALFDLLIEDACNRVNKILMDTAVHDQSFDNKISRLQMSPLLHKQLTATALGIARDLRFSGGIKRSLLKRFRVPDPGIAVEAQRRAIQSEVRNKGLPMELAVDYVDILERRVAGHSDEAPEMLLSYATLYNDLWSDPRIGARTPTRRIMLGMATVLLARSARRVASRTAPTALRK